jgi:hypothetical protein
MSEKYGFIYIWFDRKHTRYYIGSHWGTEHDGYICSSRMMRQAYKRRPEDFKRRVIKKIFSICKDLLIEEERWLAMVDPNKTMPRNTSIESRINVRYYNIKLGTQNQWWSDIDSRLTVGEKISAAKKGKSTGPCSSEKAKAISEAKKKKFAQQGGMSDEHKASLRGIKKKSHTDEWKQQNSERMKEQWNLNTARRQAISEASKKRWEEYRNKKQEQLAS